MGRGVQIFVLLPLIHGAPQNDWYLFGAPHDKDARILRSMLGSLIEGNYHISPLKMSSSRSPHPTLGSEFP